MEKECVVSPWSWASPLLSVCVLGPTCTNVHTLECPRDPLGGCIVLLATGAVKVLWVYFHVISW